MHEITLLQGLSLAALVFVLGIDFWLEALFLFRPIIVCTLTGAILGDIQTGLITGGLTELAFAGLTPAGGVQPPNPIMAGLMTTVIAWSTGVDAKTAIGLGLPFSLLMQYVILFFIFTGNGLRLRLLPGFRIEKLIHRKACAQYGNRQQVADLDVANKQETGDQVRDILRFEH